MPRVAVVSITHRTLNNIAPLLHGLIAAGVDCDVVWAPTSQAVAALSPRSLGLAIALDASGTDARDKAALARFAAAWRRFAVEREPLLVLSDDMTTWPNRVVFEEGPALGYKRPWHLAWQHGLHQPWYEMRNAFHADFFFCYGRIHAVLLGDALSDRVLPVGLAKLDQLASVDASHANGYLAWFAQPAPAVQQQVDLLAAIAAAQSLPVRIRPHPAAPDAFAAAGDLAGRGLHVDDPASDPIDALRCCNGFLSTHSSAALEALLLGKTAVLFPSFGLTSFPGYPHVASAFTAAAYAVASGRYERRRSALEAFLDDTIGGRRFDHAARSLRVVNELLELRRCGVALDEVRTRHVARLRDLVR